MSLRLAGAEPFLFRGGPVGCLLVHGFTAAPQEMVRLGAHLANHGYTALGVRLAGHGTNLDDLARTRWTDWLASAQDGLDLLSGMCNRIVLLGLSMGGLLSILLAEQTPPIGLVLMSTPTLVPPNRLRPLLRPLSPIYRRIPKGPPDWFDASVAPERVAYSAYPTRAMAEVADLIEIARAALPRVHAPALIVHSLNDDFVVPANAQTLMAELGSQDKRLFVVEGSNHLVTLDAQRQAVFDTALAFVRRTAGPAR
jgi:carboxylesterase